MDPFTALFLLSLGVGIVVKAIGRVQQASFEQDQIDAAQADLEAQQTIDAATAELLADQAEFTAEQAAAETEMLKDQAVFALDQAAFGREQVAATRVETARGLAGIGEQATASFGTQAAVGASGGLAPGASFEAVRARFERGVETALASATLRGDIAVQRGELAVTGQELQAEQLDIRAQLVTAQGALNIQGLELQQEAVEAGIESAGRQLDLLQTQEDAITSNLVFGIIGDVTNFGISFATSGLVQPNFGNTQQNVALPSFSPTISTNVSQGFNFSMFGPGSNRR